LPSGTFAVREGRELSRSLPAEGTYNRPSGQSPPRVILHEGFDREVQNSAESRAPASFAPAVPKSDAVTRFTSLSYNLRATQGSHTLVQNSELCAAAPPVGALRIARNAESFAQNSANLVTKCAHSAILPRSVVRWHHLDIELSKNESAGTCRSYSIAHFYTFVHIRFVPRKMSRRRLAQTCVVTTNDQSSRER
jgi:hypothetical protein